MFIVLICTFIFNLVSFALAIFGIIHLIGTNETYLFAPFLVIYLWSYIFLMISFSKYVRSRKINLTSYNFFNFHGEENIDIYAKFENGEYLITYEDKIIKFSIDTKIFYKGMLKAYIVRNIRFLEVSNRLPLYKLFVPRLKLEHSKIKNLTLNIEGKKHTLVKNGVSKGKYGFINRASYFKYLFGHIRSENAVRQICKINEKLFEEIKIRIK